MARLYWPTAWSTLPASRVRSAETSRARYPNAAGAAPAQSSSAACNSSSLADQARRCSGGTDSKHWVSVSAW